MPDDAAYPRVDEPAPGVVRITIPLAIRSPDHISCHLLRLPDGDLLVDTGMRGSEQALAAGLASVDARPRRVLITHGHIDHWGLATLYADRVLAHPGCAGSLQFAERPADPQAQQWPAGLPTGQDMERAFARYREMVTGVPTREDLADGDRLGDWRVMWTPGHDPGHVCLYRRSDRVLLAGDHLLPGFTPNVQPSLERPDALADYLASLRRIAQLPISLVLPAHGEPFTDAAGRAHELITHHERRLGQLEHALNAGPRSLGELTAVVFADLQTHEDKMLADMETFAHLEYLRRRARTRRDTAGAWALAA